MPTYEIPNGEGIAPADKYSITIRGEGEIDSVQSVKTMLDGIGAALFPKRDMEALISAGENRGNVIPDPNYPSPSQAEQETYGANPEQKYVTTVHYHPTPMWVKNAVHASGATLADSATSAEQAARLNPGCEINGHQFTGAENLTLTAHDIERVPKVYWGTVEPANYTGFVDLQDGDLYVKILS